MSIGSRFWGVSASGPSFQVNHPLSSGYSDGDLPVHRPPFSVPRIELSPGADPSILFAQLNQAIAARSHPPDSIFRAATDAARALTGADGVALALRTDGAVICRARSGPTAPDLGSRIDTGAGISGECLRTSEVLCCDDAQADIRVDPEVCRRLGVRSMAAVPIRGSEGAAGILEAFSMRPHAFGFEQISLLSRLAEIIEAAYTYESGADQPVLQPVAPWVPRPQIAESSTHRQPQRIVSAPSINLSTFKKHWYWITAAVVGVLLMTSVIWMNWKNTDRDVALAEPNLVASQQFAGDTGDKQIGLKRDAAVVPARSDGFSAQSVLRNASHLQPEPTADAQPQPVLKLLPGQSSSPPAASRSEAIIDEPPSVMVAERNSDEKLAALISPSPDTPRFDPVVSQGVTPAVIVQRVIPVYPAGARSLKLAGSVVLDAMIGEDGVPRELKLVSGQGALGQAAVDAVKQWRYRPALLNGKAVPSQQHITIVFKAPE